MSPCASTQMRPSGTPRRRAQADDAATLPAATLWSPPSTTGMAPSSWLASAAEQSAWQTAAISRMYFFEGSPGSRVS